MAAPRVYHWKHGWIPLDHVAASVKAHGEKVGAHPITINNAVAKVAAGEKTEKLAKAQLTFFGNIKGKPLADLTPNQAKQALMAAKGTLKDFKPGSREHDSTKKYISELEQTIQLKKEGKSATEAAKKVDAGAPTEAKKAAEGGASTVAKAVEKAPEKALETPKAPEGTPDHGKVISNVLGFNIHKDSTGTKWTLVNSDNNEVAGSITSATIGGKKRYTAHKPDGTIIASEGNSSLHPTQASAAKAVVGDYNSHGTFTSAQKGIVAGKPVEKPAEKPVEEAKKPATPQKSGSLLGFDYFSTVDEHGNKGYDVKDPNTGKSIGTLKKEGTNWQPYDANGEKVGSSHKAAGQSFKTLISDHKATKESGSPAPQGLKAKKLDYKTWQINDKNGTQYGTVEKNGAGKYVGYDGEGQLATPIPQASIANATMHVKQANKPGSIKPGEGKGSELPKGEGGGIGPMQDIQLSTGEKIKVNKTSPSHYEMKLPDGTPLGTVEYVGGGYKGKDINGESVSASFTLKGASAKLLIAHEDNKADETAGKVAPPTAAAESTVEKAKLTYNGTGEWNAYKGTSYIGHVKKGGKGSYTTHDLLGNTKEHPTKPQALAHLEKVHGGGATEQPPTLKETFDKLAGSALPKVSVHDSSTGHPNIKELKGPNGEEYAQIAKSVAPDEHKGKWLMIVGTDYQDKIPNAGGIATQPGGSSHIYLDSPEKAAEFASQHLAGKVSATPTAATFKPAAGEPGLGKIVGPDGKSIGLATKADTGPHAGKWLVIPKHSSGLPKDKESGGGYFAGDDGKVLSFDTPEAAASAVAGKLSGSAPSTVEKAAEKLPEGKAPKKLAPGQYPQLLAPGPKEHPTIKATSNELPVNTSENAHKFTERYTPHKTLVTGQHVELKEQKGANHLYINDAKTGNTVASIAEVTKGDGTKTYSVWPANPYDEGAKITKKEYPSKDAAMAAIQKEASSQVVVRDGTGALMGHSAHDQVTFVKTGNAAPGIYHYKGSGYTEMNSLLRKEKHNYSSATNDYESQTRKYIADVDAAYDKATPIQEPIMVYRGITKNIFGTGTKSAVGTEFTDWGYGSTSTSKAVSDGFKSSHPNSILLHIHVPKGYKAVSLDKPGNYESEILMDRGTRYRITSDQIVNGHRVMEAEVLGVAQK